MKTLLALTLALTVSTAFANTAKVFCKEGRQVINVLSEDGFDCQYALLQEGVCFTGNVKTALNILMSKKVSDLFEGTDGEYIKRAWIKDANTVLYLSVDDANEMSQVLSMKRCQASFFRN